MNTYDLNAWLFDVMLPQFGAWLSLVIHEAGEFPLLAALLAICLAVVALSGRNVWLVATAIVTSMFFLAAHHNASSDALKHGLFALAMFGLASLAGGAFLTRHQTRKVQRQRIALEVDNKRIQTLLDQEITWRLAADKAGVEHPQGVAKASNPTTPRS